jgi:hypothetical protein
MRRAHHFGHSHLHHHVHQASNGLSIGPLAIILLLSLAISVLMIAAMWRLFSKAGQPGWAAIIPFYNTIVLLRVIGKPWWWMLLTFIPVVNIVISVLVGLELAKSFGKGAGFGVLTFFFSIIFIPILAFGEARYVGPGGRPPYQDQPYSPQYTPQGQPYPDQSSTVQFPWN